LAFAVVGHLEWVEFVRVQRVAASGEIVQGADSFEEPAGGGGVAAVQLARLSGEVNLFTALGDDDPARRARERLEELGVHVHSSVRDAPTRRALTFIDAAGERAITTVGERLAPRIEDELPWDLLDGADGAYFTAGDSGALRAARSARVLVATPRAGPVLTQAGTELDALVFSDEDEQERAAAEDLTPKPALLVATRGAAGGSYSAPDGATGTWEAAPLPAPLVDSYGCGDSFAAALCWALAQGNDAAGAVEIAARAGAICMTGRGPYGRQLAAAEAERASGSPDAS
jgi:ribokinase